MNPLDQMRFMTRATRVEFEVSTKDWHAARYEIECWAEENFANDFIVLLAREDDLSDKKAFFVIYCVDEDIERVSQKYSGAEIRSAKEDRSEQPRLPPDWLKKYTEELLGIK